MDFVDLKGVYVIFHIIGAVLGAGGAYVSDAIFFSSTKDEVIDNTEFRFMKLGSLFVWVGLAILLLSGTLLFLTDPATYLASSKFQIKIFIVFVILLNGIFFHTFHIPKIYRHIDHHYPSSDEFLRNKKLLIMSGVISMTSWTLVLILGSLRFIPINFTEALVGYLLFEFGSILLATTLFRRVF